MGEYSEGYADEYQHVPELPGNDGMDLRNQFSNLRIRTELLAGALSQIDDRPIFLLKMYMDSLQDRVDSIRETVLNHKAKQDTNKQKRLEMGSIEYDPYEEDSGHVDSCEEVAEMLSEMEPTFAYWLLRNLQAVQGMWEASFMQGMLYLHNKRMEADNEEN